MDFEALYDQYWLTKDDSADPVRLGIIAGKVKAGNRVLDVGGQIGLSALSLKERGATVTLTDISSVALERARARGVPDVRKVDLDAEPLPFRKGIFDVVVSNSSLEHIFYPEKMISECARVLKINGTFILLVPNIAHIRYRLWLLAGRFPYKRNTPTDELHIRFMTLYEAKRLCGRYGLITERVDGNAGLWVNALYPGFLAKGFLASGYTWLARTFPSLFARDFVLIARKDTGNDACRTAAQ